jgi:protein SCO1
MAVLALHIGLVGCDGNRTDAFKSTDVTGAAFGRDFSLVDHNGTPRHLADFKGKVVVVFFGFTHCPDVCPTALAEMAKAMKQLGPDAARRVQVLFITVDPERDTQDVLHNYVTAFDPGFLGLRGTAEATQRTTQEFKVIAMKTEVSGSGNYSVDHSTQTFVFDSENRLRLFIPHSQIPNALVHDIAILLK